LYHLILENCDLSRYELCSQGGSLSSSSTHFDLHCTWQFFL
jgi:hypothetical protein